MSNRTRTGTAKRLPRGVLLDLPPGRYYLLHEDLPDAADGFTVPVYETDADSMLVQAGVAYGLKGAGWAVNIWSERAEAHECSLARFREMLHGHGRGIECALYAGRGSLGTG